MGTGGIRGAEAAGRNEVVKHVGEVAVGLVVKEDDFEIDALRDGEPLELLEDCGDVVMGAGVGEKASGKVLYVLKLIEVFGRWTIEYDVTVVRSEGDKGMGKKQ